MAASSPLAPSTHKHLMTRLFIKQLTTMDFSYLDAERGLVGESWLVDVELSGDLDDQGMVLDFAEVKGSIKQLIDLEFDHRLLIPSQYAQLSIEETDQISSVEFVLKDGRQIRHLGPRDAVRWIDSDQVTTQGVAQEIMACLRPSLPGNVTSLVIHLYPEQIDGAYYHYSHGLRQHLGNCQRIAHGHRSGIQIFRDGDRDETLEQAWSEEWRDIYIGTRSDLTSEFNLDGTDYLQFRYAAIQGQFELALPKASCYLIETDSTVENLAQHIAEVLKTRHPGSSIEVRAYEGVGKGAISAG